MLNDIENEFFPLAFDFVFFYFFKLYCYKLISFQKLFLKRNKINFAW